MAGSYRHITDKDNKFIGYDLVENRRDCIDCIEELFDMVQFLSGGDKQKIYEAWAQGHLKKRHEHYTSGVQKLPTYEEFWFDNGPEETALGESK